MKKKLSGIALFVASILILVACTNNEILSTQLVDPAPWHLALSMDMSETVTYSITKEFINVNNGEKTVAGKGVAKYTLSDFPVVSSTDKRTKLDFDFSLTHDDKSQEIDRGKTDTINSSTIFTAKSMSPVLSSRKVTIDKRFSNGVQVFDPSHTIVTDYDSRVSSMTDSTNETKKIELGSSLDVFDNETLLYAIRSFKNLNLNTKIALNLAVPKDFFENNGYKLQPIMVTASAKPTRTHLQQDAVEIQGLRQLPEDNDHDHPDSDTRHIDTLDVAIAINSPLSGIPIIASYATHPIYVSSVTNDDDTQSQKLYQIHDDNEEKGQSIQNLLINFVTQRYVSSNTLEQLTYRLLDYSIKKV